MPKKKKAGGAGGAAPADGDAANGSSSSSAPEPGAAEAEANGGDPEEPEGAEPAAKTDAARQAAGIGRITDFVEQKELDSAKAAQAMKSVFEDEAKDAAAAAAEELRERELAAVSINAADVTLIAEEMEMDKELAERKLREHNGDVTATLTSLVRQ